MDSSKDSQSRWGKTCGGYTRRAAIRPNKHQRTKRSQHFRVRIRGVALYLNRRLRSEAGFMASTPFSVSQENSIRKGT